MTTPELAKEIHAHIVSRAEWWRTNPDDSHGINTAVYVAMLEVANAINSALVFEELDREMSQQEVRQEMVDAMDCANDPTATTHVTSGKRHNEPCITRIGEKDGWPFVIYLRDGTKINVGRDKMTKGAAWLQINEQLKIEAQHNKVLSDTDCTRDEKAPS